MPFLFGLSVVIYSQERNKNEIIIIKTAIYSGNLFSPFFNQHCSHVIRFTCNSFILNWLCVAVCNKTVYDITFISAPETHSNCMKKGCLTTFFSYSLNERLPLVTSENGRFDIALSVFRSNSSRLEINPHIKLIINKSYFFFYSVRS